MSRGILALGLGIVVSVTHPISAQEQGDNVELILPAGIAVAGDYCTDDTGIILPAPCSDGYRLVEGHVAMFTGKSLGAFALGSCGPGEGHVQQIVLVDPGGQRAATRTEAILIVPAVEARPGTRLGNIQGVGSCSIGTDIYDKYRATVR